MRRNAPVLAIVTCRAFPNLYGEEQELVPRLRARGVEAEAVVWNDLDVDWSRFTAVLLRSTWDYYKEFDAFLGWLDRLQGSEVHLFNAYELVRWNSDKRYLRELEARGVPIVPTVFVEPRQTCELAGVLRERGWTRAVFKPAISADAHGARALTLDEAPGLQRGFESLCASMAVLVQPFVPEIADEGEWSFVFFEATFSHAVRKRPADDDFRVQAQFGGTVARVEPPAELRARAQVVVDALPVTPLYARVDGIRRGEAFLLTEVECIEPYLYLAAAPEKMDAFVNAVAHRVSELLPRASSRP